MFCRTRSCTKIFFRLTFASCIALLYIQIQLLPASKRNNLVRALGLTDEKIPPKTVAWDKLCKTDNSNWEKAEFPSEKSTKTLNIFKWNDVKGHSIESLVRQPWFPGQPSEISFASMAQVRLNSPDYGQWIVGYIHPDLTGEYLFGVSSDDFSEFWISTDENPANSKRVAMVLGWTRPGHHTKYLDQISDPILLKKCNKYFIEILHKQSNGNGFVRLSWKRPGYEKFFMVTSAYLSPLMAKPPKVDKPSEITLPKEHHKLQKALQRQRENKLSHDISSKYLNSRVKRLVKNDTVTPAACNFGLYKDNAKSHGNSFVAIYPIILSDKRSKRKRNQEKENIYELPEKAAKDIVANYLELLESFHLGEYSLGTIISVERKQFPNQNERYLVDLVLRRQKDEVRVTDYLFKKWIDDSICIVDELRWNPTTVIHIIVIIKNGESKWAWQLFDSIEDIATKTDDQDLHLTIIDYEKDENLKKALYASSLSVDIISKIGDVNIAESILDAIKTQPNHNEIVMVVDPHVKFPLDIMDQARKHCVESHMAFNPLGFHLKKGYSPAEPEGFWDIRGFELLAMFQNDWKRCLSTIKDGGEVLNDLGTTILLKIDVVRVRIENLYHFSSL